jgi:hypothetical protein
LADPRVTDPVTPARLLAAALTAYGSSTAVQPIDETKEATI